MKRLYFFISLFSFSLFSQNAILEIDTNYLRIGERFSITIKVYDVEKDSIVWPNTDSLFQKFELIDHSLPLLYLEKDTYVYKNYLLTSFDTGKFTIAKKV